MESCFLTMDYANTSKCMYMRYCTDWLHAKCSLYIHKVCSFYQSIAVRRAYPTNTVGPNKGHYFQLFFKGISLSLCTVKNIQ